MIGRTRRRSDPKNSLQDISVLVGKVIGEFYRNDRTQQPLEGDIRELARVNKLNEMDALAWFRIHSARNFTTEDGKEIRNWKGACTNFCKARERRRTANGEL